MPRPQPEVPPQAARAPLRGTVIQFRHCPVCRQNPLTDKQRFCSGKCRAARSRQKKAEEQAQRDRRLRELLDEALGLLGEPENSP